MYLLNELKIVCFIFFKGNFNNIFEGTQIYTEKRNYIKFI